MKTNRRIKSECNPPIEDVMGDEILTDDVYFVFGNDVVLESNLKVYLIKNQNIECYQAQ